jgi:uncharacterized protein YqgV (UPF0045/DUF77 family)
MATCFENLVKHLELAVRQMNELKSGQTTCEVDMNQVEQLLTELHELFVEMIDLYD